MSAIGAALAVMGSVVAILSVVLGIIIRATMAYTRLEMAVKDLRADLDKHTEDERQRSGQSDAIIGTRMDNFAVQLSRVDRGLAALQGRSRDR